MSIITHFYQTPDALETIAILEEPDGSIAVGFARAGKSDIKLGLVTPENGMKVAMGRAIKAGEQKTTLIRKNYLRGMYAKRMEQ